MQDKSSTPKHTNRLSQESSPYLLQHAHNPVDWYPWGEEALNKAKAENKPILVSIGYSTCHWCHVMERESFEDEQVAAYMNKFFVNIKIDREERPDVDQIYMDAVQAMTGQGGWPLNCFLTPDARPFYGGTYFPPQPAYGRASWAQVLNGVLRSFHEQPEKVNEQANKLVNYIKKSDGAFTNVLYQNDGETNPYNGQLLQNIFYKIRNQFDRVDGGFGGAPKFPGTMSLRYLLNYHFYSKNQEALEHLELSLDKMIQGGIYDQLGGGFARYATDSAWLIPHFEKMLYDNALLVGLLADTYKLTHKALYKETIEETLEFVKREMTSAEGGFYAAQDADSEGVEGKYYVWSKAEIQEILGDDAQLFCAFYDVSEEGNWEHTNIIWRPTDFETFATHNNIEVNQLKQQLKTSRDKLFEVRNHRIKPGLDDKILLNWNALMCKAYAKAYQALGDEAYKSIAVTNINFLLEKFKGEKEGLLHTYKEGKAKYIAYLNDYAYLIDALIEVYSITFDETYLKAAKKWTDYVLEYFIGEKDGLFYFSSALNTDLIVRKKDIYDNALPSGNSTMIHNLQRLSIYFDEATYRKHVENTLNHMLKSIEQYPNSLGRWANAVFNQVYQMPEIAVIGNDALSHVHQIMQFFVPEMAIMATTSVTQAYPLLKDKPVSNTTFIYVCQNYNCKLPVESIDAYKELIEDSIRNNDNSGIWQL